MRFGNPCNTGHRYHCIDAGASAEEIALRYPSLKLADVYSTISYYLQNQAQLQTYLYERRQDATAIRKQNESRFNPAGIRERLMQRRAAS